MKTLINSGCISGNMELLLQPDESLESKIIGAIDKAQAKSVTSGRGVDLVPPSFQPVYSLFAGEIHLFYRSERNGDVVTNSMRVEAAEYLKWLNAQPPRLKEYALTALQSFLKASDDESRQILY